MINATLGIILQAESPANLNTQDILLKVLLALRPCKSLNKYTGNSKETIAYWFLKSGFLAWKKIFLWSKEGKPGTQRKKNDTEPSFLFDIFQALTRSLGEILVLRKKNGTLPVEIVNELKVEWESCIQNEKYSCCSHLVDLFLKIGQLPIGTNQLFKSTVQEIVNAKTSAPIDKPKFADKVELASCLVRRCEGQVQDVMIKEWISSGGPVNFIKLTKWRRNGLFSFAENKDNFAPLANIYREILELTSFLIKERRVQMIIALKGTKWVKTVLKELGHSKDLPDSIKMDIVTCIESLTDPKVPESSYTIESFKAVDLLSWFPEYASNNLYAH